MLSVAAALPVWLVKYPPLQDLPDHLAALRVVHDYTSPGFGFEDHFQLQLHKTAYVLYYLVGSFLAALFDVRVANTLLISVYLVGTPLAVQKLLRAFRKDERLSLLAIPLVMNTMFMYGLLPFLFGIPFMLWAMALAIQYLRSPTVRRGLALAAVCVLLFFAHVHPFGFFTLFFITAFPWAKPRTWIRAGAPTVPSLLCIVWWIALTPAGGKAQTKLLDIKPLPFGTSIENLWLYSGRIFRDRTDEFWMGMAAAVAATMLVLSRRDARKPDSLEYRYRIFILVLGVLYFLVGERLGGVFLFAQRFPSVILLCSIPLLDFPRGKAGHAVFAGLAVVAIGTITNVSQHFIEFEETEVGHFDAALASMDPNKKVCGLIFEPRSKVTYRAPFLHFVSYYQAEKGGVTVFTFSEHAHWPFRFRPTELPPQGIKGLWEWRPKSVQLKEIFPYYDYVLTRGPGFSPPSNRYRVHFHSGSWRVWKRVDASSAARREDPSHT